MTFKNFLQLKIGKKNISKFPENYSSDFIFKIVGEWEELIKKKKQIKKYTNYIIFLYVFIYLISIFFAVKYSTIIRLM